MATYGELIELSSAKRNEPPYVSDGKYSNAKATISGPKTDNGLRDILGVRKLFSATQIFAFSLTYMCSWEVLTS
jgi:hypothetical protein